jgi:ribosome-binding factor A
MNKRRIKSANLNLRDELSEVVRREMEFPDILVTITRVEASADLRSLLVFVSTMPEEALKKTLRTLRRNIFMIKGALVRRVKIKYIPKISFRPDEGSQNYAAVEQIIGELKNEKSVSSKNKTTF